MLQRIENFIAQNNLIKQNDTIIIGLSGGPDSTFLLHTLKNLQQGYNLTVIAAHLNHEWRSQADAEEALCKETADRYDVPFVSVKISALSHPFKIKGSKEEYARKIRRFFLEKVLQEHGAQHIALGHHAQDQQETFFIRLIRGAGLTGLTCMKPKHGHYIRPLLNTNKQDIVHWLEQHNIAYAIDTSNESPLFLRNRIRAHVLPALYECDTRFGDNFLKTIQRLQEAEQFLEKEAHKAFNAVTRIGNNHTQINTLTLALIHPVLQQRVVTRWLITERAPFTASEAFLGEIIRFLLSPRGGVHTIDPSWSIVKKRNEAYIQKI